MARNVTDREIAEARDRGAQMRAAGLAATSVRYDGDSRRILLELTNGALFGVPVSSLTNIAGANPDDLATVELIGESIVHIESLDADYSVAGLVTNAFGRVAAARALGRAGGAATSDAKTESSRRNGAKGGRPPSVDKVTVKSQSASAKSFFGRVAAKRTGKPATGANSIFDGIAANAGEMAPLRKSAKKGGKMAKRRKA